MDLYLFSFLNGLAGIYPWFDNLIIFFAKFLGYLLIAILIFFFLFPKFSLFFKKSTKEIQRIIVEVFSSAILSRFIFTEIIRFFYNNPRPFELNTVNQLINHSSGFSFPSGHAAFFFALSSSIYIYDKRLGSMFFISSFLITISRVIGGVHWPSDIFGGFILALLTSYLFHYFFKKINH